MSSRKPTIGLARPSTISRAAKTAAKLETHNVRLVLECSEETRHNLKLRATQQRLTVKAYLFGLAARDGVEISEPTDDP
jgi:hypothetical protein